jgi:hypothetical protein
MASSADSTTQLGSLALLASLTLGTGAIFSSAIELSVMNTSFRNVLFLKEVMINGQASAHVRKRARKKNIIGFTHNTVLIKAVRMMDFVKSTSLLGVLILGRDMRFFLVKKIIFDSQLAQNSNFVLV